MLLSRFDSYTGSNTGSISSVSEFGEESFRERHQERNQKYQCLVEQKWGAYVKKLAEPGKGSQRIRVASGNKKGIIARLSTHDHEFVDDFLLSYRRFYTTESFVELLIEWYEYQSTDLSELVEPDEVEELKDWQKVTRLRIVNVVKKFMQKNTHDLDASEEALRSLVKFFEDIVKEADQQLAKHVGTLQDRVASVLAFCNSVTHEYDAIPKVPAHESNISYALTFSDADIAAELTVIEMQTFCAIKPHEFMGKAWEKGDAKSRAPHLSRLIERFNLVSFWFAFEIAKAKRRDDRVFLIKKFIKIAKFCKEANNFNTCVQIIGALNHSSISRLKKTWKSVPNKFMNVFNELTEMCNIDNNYAAYRKALNNAIPPTVPYIAVVCKDLVAIDEVLVDRVTTESVLPSEVDEKGSERDELINFLKVERLAGIVRKLLLHQSADHSGTKSNDHLRSILLSPMPQIDEKLLYEMSLLAEPRAQQSLRRTGSLKQTDAANSLDDSFRKKGERVETIVEQARRRSKRESKGKQQNSSRDALSRSQSADRSVGNIGTISGASGVWASKSVDMERRSWAAEKVYVLEDNGKVREMSVSNTASEDRRQKQDEDILISLDLLLDHEPTTRDFRSPQLLISTTDPDPTKWML